MATSETRFGYDYVTLTLGSGPAGAVQRRLRERLSSDPKAVAKSGQGLVALFAPQLGWPAHQAAALVRGDAGALGAMFDGDPVVSRRQDRLRPTLRPTDEATPPPGGVYVHRWFTVKTGDLDEFLQLSGHGWVNFEQTFDARIYGLFEAARSETDLATGVVRVLLLTRYGDHRVWQASRDPTTDAMQIFMRRQALTVETIACSTLLVPLDQAS